MSVTINDTSEEAKMMRELHGQLVLDEQGFLKKVTQKDPRLNKQVADRYYSHWSKKETEIKDNDSYVSNRREQAQNMTNAFYDLATDFYDIKDGERPKVSLGWGQSFHFARLYKGDTFEENIKRHEAFLALKLGLNKGMRVLDVGCGVGGPLREIVKSSGYAHVTGINNNAYQIQRCFAYAAKYGLEDHTDFVKGDFTRMPMEDNTFDAVFSVEATVHAPRLEMVYSEIYRVLKPGGRFACYEWCTTPSYDETDAVQRRVIHGIEQGNSISKLYSTAQCLTAAKSVGFKVIEEGDFAPVDNATEPWYNTLSKPQGVHGILRSPWGRFYTHSLLTFLSKFGVVPPGVLETSQLLNDAAEMLVAGGKMEIFTPMYFFLVEKPLDAE